MKGAFEVAGGSCLKSPNMNTCSGPCLRERISARMPFMALQQSTSIIECSSMRSTRMPNSARTLGS
eukprot:8947448-Karenia_brevis.AAC.1